MLEVIMEPSLFVHFFSRVLYFSIHRYEHGKFWPQLRESDYDFIGKGPGEGFNINIPLNKVNFHSYMCFRLSDFCVNMCMKN